MRIDIIENKDGYIVITKNKKNERIEVKVPATLMASQLQGFIDGLDLSNKTKTVLYKKLKLMMQEN